MAENPTMEVRARLTAETAQFTNGMQKAAQATQQLTQSSQRLQSVINTVGIATAAATTAVIALGVKSFMAAARVDELDYAINAVGKSTGLGYEAIQSAAIAIKGMGIEMEIAQKSALKFAQNNLDLAYAADLARVAQDLAVISGMNSTDTYNMLTHAVITGRSEVLKSVGIQKSAGQMYAEFAASIGKTAKQLSFQEKQQAVATGALKEGAKVAGTYEQAMLAPGKLLRSFARLHNELQVSIGGVLLKGFGPMIFSLYQFEKAISKAFTQNEAFKKVLDAMKLVLVKLTTPFVNAIDAATKWIDTLKVGGDSVTALASKFESILPVLAGFAAFMSAKVGASIMSTIPGLGAFAKFLSPLPIAILAMAATSTQMRNALIQLATALMPLGRVLLDFGKTVMGVASVGIALLAKGISGLASVVRNATTFLQQHASIARFLGVVIIAAGAAFVAYKAYVAAAAAATWLMTTAQNALNAAQLANPIGLIIGALVALVVAFAAAWKNSETFREVMTTVIDAVASVWGRYAAFVLRSIAKILTGFSTLFDVHGILGNITAQVFNAVIRIIALAVTVIITQFANFIKGIATVIYFIEKLLEVSKIIVKAVVSAFAALGKGVFNVFKGLANGISDFLQNSLNTVVGWARSLVSVLMGIPIVGDALRAMFNGLQSMTTSFTNTLRNMGGSLSDMLFGNAESGAAKQVDAISGVSTALITAQKGWGNYDTGVAGVLSNIANKMLDFNQKIVDLASKDIGTNIVKLATGATAKAGDMLNSLADKIETFTTTGFIKNVGNAFDGLLASLKSGMGFADTMAEEKAKFEKTVATGLVDDTAAKDIAGNAKQMDKIREAMRAGLESMRKTVEDLQSAAQDFANSLKDTIVGFAGLKGVELPDGFIPQAKSLIENMRMRLAKSEQFAKQIAQLQALGLDPAALKAIIEEGPIKGAQLASSILSGGIDAVRQVSALQTEISKSGAAIGAIGADVAYSGLISNAQTTLAGMEAQNYAVRSAGSTVNISQGAFVVNIDTSGAKDTDERIDIITIEIEKQFARLAKSLATQ